MQTRELQKCLKVILISFRGLEIVSITTHFEVNKIARIGSTGKCAAQNKVHLTSQTSFYTKDTKLDETPLKMQST